MFAATEYLSDTKYEADQLRVRTLEEVARELGLSPSSVWKAERNALRKVRLCERIKELAPRGQAWPLIDGLRGRELEEFREVVRRLKQERAAVCEPPRR